ncbi:unnamed protein product [Adineta ricciae]|uniref:DUF4139 domain-containing protein n=1 Tax=Adineta ricciae TaxID=249248 RepID=A0A815RHI5_ADIRI|nr:unnamed protein product [Adineta ricciae]
MKAILLLLIVINTSDAFLHFSKNKTQVTTDHRILANVKIYSNLAEIIQPLGKLPLEFSEDDWRDIRPDSLTLVGSNVTVTQQTITEKKQSLNNAHVFVRAPSSSNTETKFVKATLVDEKRNLVKLIDKDVSKEPIYFTASSDHIVYESDPPQSKYYVNFTFDTSDAVYVSYLRSNLNWKTRYQLNLFDESKSAVLISMADIRNDGQSRVDIEHAELLGGDINLQIQSNSYWKSGSSMHEAAAFDNSAGIHVASRKSFVPSIGQGEEVAGLYVFTVSTPFSVEGKTNYLLPMFRPRATVERFALISKYFSTAGASNGKAQRSYRLSADRFLSKGNCIIREYDRLVGETSLPNLAAKNPHDFAIGEDADVVYKENVTLISAQALTSVSSSYHGTHGQTKSTYNVNLYIKSYKNRPFKLEYQQHVHASAVKLIEPRTNFTLENSAVKYKTTLAANEEKVLSYKLEVVN